MASEVFDRILTSLVRDPGFVGGMHGGNTLVEMSFEPDREKVTSLVLDPPLKVRWKLVRIC